MKNRGNRTVTELYDRTEKIPRSEIQGRNCKEVIGDMAENDAGTIKEEKTCPSRKRKMDTEDNSCTQPESGVCNVCCAPCSSCFHRMNTDTEISSFVDNCSETSSRASYCEQGNAESKNQLQNPNSKIRVEVKKEGQGENSLKIGEGKEKSNRDKCDLGNSEDKFESKIRVSEKTLKIEEKMDEICYSTGNEKIGGGVSCSQDKSETKIRVSEKITDAISSQDEPKSKIRVLEKNSKIDEKGKQVEIEEIEKDNQKQDEGLTETTNNNDPDNGLIDVKVCDICGDTGREELLATCTRCIDGAEHTYCMRVKMEKLPEGEWLCEECQLKEKLEKENKIKSALIPNTPRHTPRFENKDKNPFKRLRVSTDKHLDSDAPLSLSKTPVFKEPIVASPRKIVANSSRENSLPKSSQIVKGSNIEKKPEFLSPKSVGSLSRSFSLSNVASPKGIEKKSEFISPKASLTKHLSFKNLPTKPKVKPLGPKPTGLSISKPTGEETRFKRLVKCASLKEGGGVSTSSSTRPDFDLGKKFEPIAEKEKEKEKGKEREREKEKERERDTKSLQKIDSFKGENRASGLVPKPGTIIKKSESKVEGNVIKKSEYGTSSSIKKDSGFGDKKKRDLPIDEKKGFATKLNEPKISRSIQISNQPNKKYSKWRPAIKTVVSEGKNVISDKSKDQVSKSRFSSSNSIPPKEMFYNKDLKDKKSVPSSSNTEEISKSRVFRDQNAISNNLEGSSKSKMNLDPPITSTTSRVLTDQNAISNNLEGSSKSKMYSDPPIVSATSRVMVEESSKDIVSTSNAISTNLEDLNAKSVSHVFPEHDFIWQGNFDILRDKKLRDRYGGIQAHFSTRVSPKVVEIVAKLSNNLRLDAVPCATSWPVQFQKTNPNEEHIALFFFAKDTQCYDNSYRKLLQLMIGEDLALKGDINGVDLLIFSSNKLPKISQRWNDLFYLWGVFRAKKQDSPIIRSFNSQKIICEAEPSSSNIVPTKINKNEKPNLAILSRENNSPKPMVEELIVSTQTANTSKNDLNKIENNDASRMEKNNNLSLIINQAIDNKNETLVSHKRARSPEKDTNHKKQRDCTNSYAEPNHTESNMLIDLEQPAQVEDEGEYMNMIDLNELPPKINLELGNENPRFEPDTVPVVPLLLFPPVRVKEEEQEDKSLSLSLTIGGVSSSEVERENEIKPDVNVQQFLPETPGAKKGQFRLFGGYINP